MDTAVVTLTYADGRIAVIKNSRVQFMDMTGNNCLGPKIVAGANMLKNTVVKSTTNGVTGAKPTYFFLERYMPAYAAEWGAFVDALINGADILVTLSDGTCIAMAEVATQSAKTAMPVKLGDV